MAKTFQHGDTVICLGRILNRFTGALTSPATSTKISIFNPSGTLVVTAQNATLSNPVLTVDSVEYNYYYDYAPAADAPNGKYTYKFYAVDGTRNTEHDGDFILE
jgi:hypothetical protein